MNGILIIDKPTGWTSHDVVNKARRILQEKKIGHTGTLDPLATGVLVLCIGKATRIVRYLESDDKAYIAELRLGITTDTLDSQGKVLD
jgi:tRNA pseudouridine55 synthase